MHFPVRFTLGIVLSATLLAGCSKPGLPPTEVLSNATAALEELQTARFSFDASIQIDDASGQQSTADIDLSGTLQNGGDQIAFTIDAAINSQNPIGMGNIGLNGEVRVAGPNEVYVLLNDFTSSQNALFSPEVLSGIKGKWWLMPSDEAAPSVINDVSPDPSLLRAQAEVVTITKNRNIRKRDGVDVYHYDTALDKEKLRTFMQTLAAEKGNQLSESDEALIDSLDATGELIIDAETYFVREIRWDIHRAVLADGRTAQGNISFVLSDHNAAPQIVPPTGATPLALPNLIPGSTATGDTLPVEVFSIPLQ